MSPRSRSTVSVRLMACVLAVALAGGCDGGSAAGHDDGDGGQHESDEGAGDGGGGFGGTADEDTPGGGADGDEGEALPARRIVARYDSLFSGPQAERRQVEVFVPAGAGPHPWVLYVHGGGYRHVRPSRGEPVAEVLQAAGVAAALVGYRLSPEADTAAPDRVRHPDHVRDLATATRFLVDHAATFRLDPDRRGVVGHSSGAHLGALLLANPTFLAERGLRTADWDAGVLLDAVEYRLDDFVARTRPAMPPSTETVFGVTRTRTPPSADARPVGYRDGPLYDVATDPAQDASGPWLYPALLSADGAPERLARPHPLNLSPYHNIAAGDDVAPLLLVFGVTPDRERAAHQLRDAVRAQGGVAEAYDARPLNHGQMVHAFGDAQAAAYRETVLAWLDRHLR